MLQSGLSGVWGVICFLGVCAIASADIATISVVPSSQSATLGSPVNVSLFIANPGEPPSLGTFDLNINYDPTILSFRNATFGDPTLGDQLDPTGGGNAINFFVAGAGTVELFELSLESASDLNALQAHAFELADLVFDTVGVGSSAVALSINALGDENGSSLAASLQDGRVGVSNLSSVPEPTSVSLTGIMFLVWIFFYESPRFQRTRQTGSHSAMPRPYKAAPSRK